MAEQLPPLVEDLASQVSLRPDGTAWRVQETETAYIEVAPMMFNDRVMVVPKDSPFTYGRYWCYQKGGAAILAALAWDGADDTEPVGWIKSWDQRYGQTTASH